MVVSTRCLSGKHNVNFSEDRLNEEVKQLLDSRTKEYERSMMDYGRVFQLVKSKLARERGLVL